MSGTQNRTARQFPAIPRDALPDGIAEVKCVCCTFRYFVDRRPGLKLTKYLCSECRALCKKSPECTIKDGGQI